MPKTASELLAFIWAVINSWAGYSTGGIIVALVTFWQVLKGKALPRRLGIALACLFLFLGFFKAWQEQYQRADQLQSRLDKTPAPPTVQVNVPPTQVIMPSPPPKHARIDYDSPPKTSRQDPLLPYHVGEKPALNVAFSNGSPDAQISSASTRGFVIVVPTVDYEKNSRLYLSELRKEPATETGTINPGSTGGYLTHFGPPLTEDDVIQLNAGTKSICVLAITTWRDESGTYQTDFGFCYVAPPGEPGNFNWRILTINQRETKLSTPRPGQ